MTNCETFISIQNYINFQIIPSLFENEPDKVIERMQDKSIYELFKNAFACKNEEIPYTKEQLKCEIITFKSEQYPEFGTVNAVIVYLENSDFSIGRLLAVSSENEEYKGLFVYSEESGKHFLRFRIDGTSYTKKIDMCPTQENIKGIFDFIINFINITEEQNGINLFEDENGNINSKYAALLGKGDIPTMIMFGDCYQDYKDCPITPDYSKSLHYYKSAMEKGSGIGEWKYGWLLYQMALSKDEISKAKAHINNAIKSGEITEDMNEKNNNSKPIHLARVLNHSELPAEEIEILKFYLCLSEYPKDAKTHTGDTCRKFEISKQELTVLLDKLRNIDHRQYLLSNNFPNYIYLDKAEKLDTQTLIYLGDVFFKGTNGVRIPDFSKALSYYKAAMKKGSNIGEWKYGWLLYQLALNNDEVETAEFHINNALNSGKITEKMQEYTENSYGIYWSKILNKNYFHWEKIRILKYSLSLTECHLSLMTPMDDTCGRFGITKDKLREMVRRLLYIQRREGRKRNN